jgi:D-galacturonate reductase
MLTVVCTILCVILCIVVCVIVCVIVVCIVVHVAVTGVMAAACPQWCLAGRARPVLVIGSGSTGVAKRLVGADVEDTITLTVHWENLPSGTIGGASWPLSAQCVSTGYARARCGRVCLAVAVYTSSWIAPKSDVHSQQRFFYMGHHGEINIDQVRGCGAC